MAADKPRKAAEPPQEDLPDAAAMKAEAADPPERVRMPRRPEALKKPKADPDRGAMETVETVVRILGGLAIAVSAGVAVWQYVDQNNDTRKARSIAFMSTWQDGDARDAYARLSSYVEGAVTRAGALLPADANEETLRLAQQGIGARLVRQLDAGEVEGANGWRDDVGRLVDFYSEVEFCLSAGLCDKELIVGYFGADVVSFWDYYRDAADQPRENFYPAWGAGVDRLVALVDAQR